MSANSGEGIYNRVIVEGTGADGAPISVERSSSQLAGVTASPVTSPAADNPSFATNTSSWTASSGSSITRDTGVFDTSPASGRWDRSGGNLVAWDTLTETFTGTFLAGVTYTLTFKGDRSGPVSSFEYTFGTATDFARNANPFDPIGAFRVFQVSWTPSVTVSSGVTLRLRPYVGHPAYLWIDSLALAVAQPTLVDRRGFRRTHTLPVKSSLTEALAAQIGDTWLRGAPHHAAERHGQGVRYRRGASHPHRAEHRPRGAARDDRRHDPPLTPHSTPTPAGRAATDASSRCATTREPTRRRSPWTPPGPTSRRCSSVSPIVVGS